jgi:hypothetical protein
MRVLHRQAALAADLEQFVHGLQAEVRLVA